MSEKIIRDPVHDVIAFRTERPRDRLLFNLVNAVEFQRLRRIRQLGMASLAYPGADHSRYNHSLGVMETARQMLDHLRRFHTIDENEETVCLIAALLHDLGHGPFSHVFERVSGAHHEDLTRRVVADPESEVHRRLVEFDRALPDKVVALMECRGQRTFFSDVLCSQLDADRLDYLLRDNLMTGSGYGGYDLRWLLVSLTMDDAGSRLAVTWKGVSAVEAYLQSRYHMYRNVYLHKVVRAAEGMVKLALQRGKRLLIQGRLPWPPPETPVHKALSGRRISVAEFTDLDDISVMACFKQWTAAADPVLSSLCRGLLFRRLYKTIDLSQRSDSEARAAFAAAQSAVEDAGGEPAYDLFYDEPSDTPYEVYRPEEGKQGTEIMVRDAAGGLTEFAKISPVVRALNQELMFKRIHVSEQWADPARRAVTR